MKSVDLTGLKLIAQRDLDAVASNGTKEIVIREGAVLTPSARDIVAQRGLTLRTCNNGDCPAPVRAITAAAVAAPAKDRIALFYTPEAEAIKQEICAVGKKLWMRSYVDGNGGNISYRIGPNEVICTPTLISKADLRPEDLCLVDLEGTQLVGSRPRTSEILLHLEIYKAVPEAKGVVHCHPAHATAYAITGRIPPSCVIPEYEVFIGTVAVSPYETPGTQKFAETVIPYVRNHNTVLLSNHGIICWADTVTHAEWYAEVVDTYCWTLMNAQQLGVPITRIPEDKTQDLLAIKKKLGLPDARFGECALSDIPVPDGAIAYAPAPCSGGAPRLQAAAQNPDVETLVKAVTDAVMAAIQRK